MPDQVVRWKFKLRVRELPGGSSRPLGVGDVVPFSGVAVISTVREYRVAQSVILVATLDPIELVVGDAAGAAPVVPIRPEALVAAR